MDDAVFVVAGGGAGPAPESQFVRPTIPNALFDDSDVLDSVDNTYNGVVEEGVSPDQHHQIFASLPSQRSIVLVPTQLPLSQGADFSTTSRGHRKQLRPVVPQQLQRTKHVQFDVPAEPAASSDKIKAPKKISPKKPPPPPQPSAALPLHRPAKPTKRGRLDAAIQAITAGVSDPSSPPDALAVGPTAPSRVPLRLDPRFSQTQSQAGGEHAHLLGNSIRARLLNPTSRGPGAVVPDALWSLLKPHQRSALQFMWNILARPDGQPLSFLAASASAASESAKKRQRLEHARRVFMYGSQDEAADEQAARDAEASEAVPARGCILAHAMGLGKTLSTVALLFMLWRYLAEHPDASPQSLSTGVKCVLCVPKSVVFHWVRELNHWASAAGEKDVVVYFLSGESRSDKSLLVAEWAAQAKTGRCILLLTHSMLTHIMSGDGQQQHGKKVRQQQAPHAPRAEEDRDWADDDDDGDAGELEALGQGGRQAATKAMYATCKDLIAAACNLLVLDEAHKLQSVGSRLASAVSHLSPGCLRLALTGTPITGNNFRAELRALLQCVMPTLWSDKDLSDRAVGQFAKDVMHGRSISVLLPELPRLIEHEVLVRLSPAQTDMFRELIYLQEEKGIIPPKKLLETVFRSMLIGNHCDLVADWARARMTPEQLLDTQQHHHSVSRALQWALPALALPSALDDDPSASLEHSWKMCVALSLVRSALERQEKVVVFSHSIKTLALMGRMLQFGGMVDGEDFGVISGHLPAAQRDDVTNTFNEQIGRAHV